MVQSGAHLHPPILEDEHVLHVGSLAELLIALSPNPHQRLGAYGRECAEGAVVAVGVHHHLRRSIWRLKGRESIVKDGNLEAREGDLCLYKILGLRIVGMSEAAGVGRRGQ